MLVHWLPLLVFGFLCLKLIDGQMNVEYRCLKCGASRPDMHSRWCEDKGD